MPCHRSDMISSDTQEDITDIFKLPVTVASIDLFTQGASTHREGHT